MTRILAAFTATLLTACGGTTPPPGKPPVVASPISELAGLDAYVEQAMHDWGVPGLALAVVKDDQVVLVRGYGVRELGKPEPVDADTLFQIASCTKAFTSTALAMLVAAHQLDWDDPIAAHMPPLRTADPAIARQITVRDLLLNRSGLPGLEVGADQVWFGKSFSRDQVLAHVGDVKGWPLRAHFDYSNMGYLAAGQLIPAVTHTSWDDFVRDRIFRPLGMTRTSTTVEALRHDPDVAHAHTAQGGHVEAADWASLDEVGPAGSIVSSARDMAQWLRLQLADGQLGGQHLVDATLIETTHEPGIAIPLSPGSPLRPVWKAGFPGAEALQWGMGWASYDYRGERVVEHIGIAPGGMHAVVSLMPGKHLGIVVLTNLDFFANLLPEVARYWIYDAYLGGPHRDWNAYLLAHTGHTPRPPR